MRKIYKKLKKKLNKGLDRFLPLMMLIFLANLLFPHVTLAQTIEPISQLPLEADRIEVITNYPTLPRLPKIEIKQPDYTINIWVTAYNSVPGQTDSTPCITASNLNICERGIEDIIATNFLPMGTKIRLPDLFGDKIFEVQDRMNKRYYYRADIWMNKDIQKAKAFGVKWTKIEVL